METALVTVCITTYNRASILPSAIQSVLRQTYQHFEIIIVDDCSSDHTKEVVEKWMEMDKRIRYFRHEKNKGLPAGRNTAIKNANGKFFTFIDDDDSWSENFIEAFVNLASQYDANWCFCCGTKAVDDIGQILYTYYQFEGNLLDYCLQGYTPPVAAQFYFTHTLEKAGGYREQIKSGVDHDLWLTLAFHGIKIKSLNQCLAQPFVKREVGRVRMTNQYDKRINGIRHSLSVWKQDIVTHAGDSFYNAFSQAYLLREKKKFFRLYVTTLQFSKALKIYREIRSSVKIKEIGRYLLTAMMMLCNIKIKKTVHRNAQPQLQIKRAIADNLRPVYN